MQSQYKIPLHYCQWCYKNTGRFIIDCLCIVCESCYKSKQQWIDEKGGCFYCQKPTQRKFIDLKVNPQQGGLYFQNLNMSMKNVMKIQQFQSQVSRKYCKHLQKKVSKLQMIIVNFLKQFPQFGQYFDNAMAQLQQRQNHVYRSKSMASDFQPNQRQGAKMFHNNTEKNLAAVPRQLKSISKQNNYIPQKRQGNSDFPEQSHMYRPQQQKQYPVKKSRNQFSVTSNQSDRLEKQEGYFDTLNTGFHPQNQGKMPIYQNQRAQINKNMQQPRPNQSNIIRNQQGDPQIQIYTVGGSKKFSDPTKQQINLNNINLQTALRSIKSEDGRDNFLPFYQNNMMDSRQKLNRNQIKQFREPNEDMDNGRKGKGGFHGFGRNKGNR